MDSNHLFYFKAIAEAGSLTQAARLLHVSQPALSKSLARLEADLGRSLFNRVGGRLYINGDGKALLEYVNRIEELFSEIEKRFERGNESQGSLSLYSIGNYFTFIMKNYFQYDTHPLSLKVVPNAQIAEALFSGAADAAIADDIYLQASREVGLKRIPILNEQLLLMIPHGHPLSGRKAVGISELSSYPIMRLNTNYWLEEIPSIKKAGLNLSWSVDSDTWNLYWNGGIKDIPLSFDTSASFVTNEMLKARRRRCDIARAEGAGTSRMLYLWYFETNEKKLATFLNCVRLSFR